MKNVLVIHDDKNQIFTFLNHLLGDYALIHTKIDHHIQYDCILASEDMILEEDSRYLELSSQSLRAPEGTILSVFLGDEPSPDSKVFEYADIQVSIEAFTTLYDPEAEDIFRCMWNLPIKWKRRTQSN